MTFFKEILEKHLRIISKHTLKIIPMEAMKSISYLEKHLL